MEALDPPSSTVRVECGHGKDTQDLGSGGGWKGVMAVRGQNGGREIMYCGSDRVSGIHQVSVVGRIYWKDITLENYIH